MPYPARASVPKLATSFVRISTVRTACSGENAATAPTFRMSKNIAPLSLAPNVSVMRALPERRNHSRNAAPRVKPTTYPDATPIEPEAGKRSEAEPESAAQYDLHGGSGEQGERRHAHVARAAHDGRQRVEEPDHDRAREPHAGIQDSLIEDRTAAAECAQDRSPKQPEQQREAKTRHDADSQCMHGKGGCALTVACAERAADRRGDAAAHRAGREHLHQHDEGKDQGDGSELRGAQDAHIDGLEDRHQCGDEHGREIGRRQPEERRQDGRGQEWVGRLGCACGAGNDLVHGGVISSLDCTASKLRPPTETALCCFADPRGKSLPPLGLCM